MSGIDQDITPDRIMLSHLPALAGQAKTWKFLELWVDPVLFPGVLKGYLLVFDIKVNFTFWLGK